MSEYHVIYERDPDSGWWLARVPKVQGCHTQGRTIEESKRRIQEALGLFVDDAKSATFDDDVRMPAQAKRAVLNYFTRRRRAEAQEQEASEAQKEALLALQQEPLNLSIRDTAAVLKLSHQRVHQLVQARNRSEPPHRRTTRRR